jgi:hypothetical protein
MGFGKYLLSVVASISLLGGTGCATRNYTFMGREYNPNPLPSGVSGLAGGRLPYNTNGVNGSFSSENDLSKKNYLIDNRKIPTAGNSTDDNSRGIMDRRFRGLEITIFRMPLPEPKLKK